MSSLELQTIHSSIFGKFGHSVLAKDPKSRHIAPVSLPISQPFFLLRQLSAVGASQSQRRADHKSMSVNAAQVKPVSEEEEEEEEDGEPNSPLPDPTTSLPSLFHHRSGSSTPRSRQSSPRLGPTRFASSDTWDSQYTPLFWGFDKGVKMQRRATKRKVLVDRAWYSKKRVKGVAGVIGLLILFFLMNWVMLLRLQDHGLHSESGNSGNSSLASVSVKIREKWKKLGKGKKAQKGYYGRMLDLAAHALAEGHNKPEPKDLWLEPFVPASSWKPCADQRSWEPNEGKNGYIMVTANGGMNQQRVAVCNAVAITRLLNSTLVIPNFLYSSIWRDVSQFSDIYQEEHFINYLTPDIRIVKELPKELQSLDLGAIGSVVTDVDIPKEAKPSFFLKHITPILLKNGVVHFLGFGNRLAFDPIPFELQIQEAGALLLQRLRQNEGHRGPLDQYLVGSYAERIKKQNKSRDKKASRYLALHLRFEIDMVSHSLCEFGGGDEERKELEAYREIHFPALTLLKKTTKLPTPAELRSEGLCPLTPEEAVLMLAALGFTRKTHIFVAGSQIYGGRSRMIALMSLYPKLVTKEILLTPAELEPFMNFSSQLAALDFIGCTAADAFAMTDSGSQLSSLVSGFRIYFGGGRTPTIRPNKRRLASIFLKNNTIEWRVFEQRIRKAVRQTKHIQPRPKARSTYRYPRCDECMCNMTILT